MKIDLKKTIVQLFFSEKIFFVLIAGAVLMLIFSARGFAPTKMADSDLSNVDGQAFFSITSFSNSVGPLPSFGGRSYDTQAQNVIRLSLGLDLEMMAHMGSFKMGYYNGGWDLDQVNYFWGNQNHTTSPLVWTGIFLDIGFENISNDASRRLNYIELGTMSASGRVTGAMNTLNTLCTNLGTGQNNGVLLRSTAGGTRTIHFNNEVMTFVFATRYRYEDNSGNGTENLTGIFIKIPNYNSNNTN